MNSILAGRGVQKGGWLRSRALQLAGWLSVPLFPLVCLLGMDAMNGDGQWEGPVALWNTRPASFCFEVLVLGIGFVFLLLLVRRVWCAAALFGAVSVIFSYVNYTKLALNGDPFLPQDLLLASQAGEVASFVSGGVPPWFLLFAAGLLVWVVLFALLGLALPRGIFFWRWSLAALLAVATVCVSGDEERRTAFLSGFDLSLAEIQDTGQCYRSNGFAGGFVLNLLGMKTWVPAGYSRSAVEDLLAPYDAVAREGSFDVLVVLSESFSDVRELPGVTFSDNPLAGYDELLARENCRSGSLYVTAMSGGTVRTEFSMLTGLTMDFLGGMSTPWWYVRQPLPGYVSQYRDSGYRTIALHPYDGSFYRRDQAFPWLGFDRFVTQPDLEELTEVEYRGGYVSDRTVTRAAIRLVEDQEQLDPRSPVFLYIATMEAHQPYPALPEEEISIRAHSSDLSAASLDTLNAYVQRLADADSMLTELADWIDGRERPTVLVFFGDHRPNLGPNHQAYNESGLYCSRDGFTPEEYQVVFRTPFLVYSNRELQWDLLPRKTGNAISDYMLLTAVARATGGARSAWMELLGERAGEVPWWNARLMLPSSPAREELARALRLVSYDRLLGRGWSADGGG